MRAIVFDLDGTLLHYTREYRSVLAETFERVAGEVREEWLAAYDRTFFDLFEAHERDPVRRAFAAALEAGAEPGEGSEPRADAADGVEAAPDASPDGATPDALVAALRERETAMCEPPDGTVADLDRLGDDHALAVLTNGLPAWQAHKLRACGLADHFDCVVTSYDVGAHKPDPTVFRAVEDRLDADAYAMVGDSDADVEGATNAGWAAYRYDGGGFGDLPDAIDWE